MLLLINFDQVLRIRSDEAYSPKCLEVEFCELRLEGVLESGNRKPYSSKPPKGFKSTSPR
jgi:hypothetical protein